MPMPRSASSIPAICCSVQAWRNDVSELRCLVESGAPLDVQDAESGWCADGCCALLACWLWLQDGLALSGAPLTLSWHTSFGWSVQRIPEAQHEACGAPFCRTALHRALYFGHFRCAAVLLEAGASLTNLDHQVFTQFGQLSWIAPCWCTTEQCSICLLRAALRETAIKLA